MNSRIGVLLAILFFFVLSGWRMLSRQDDLKKEHEERLTHTLSKMTPVAFNDSRWKFSGAMGEFEFNIIKGGALRVTSNTGETREGTWEVADRTLNINFPGLDQPLRGVYQDPPNLITGPNPPGSPARSWTAVRDPKAPE